MAFKKWYLGTAASSSPYFLGAFSTKFAIASRVREKFSPGLLGKIVENGTAQVSEKKELAKITLRSHTYTL